MKLFSVKEPQIFITLIFISLLSIANADQPQNHQEPKSLLQKLVDSYINSSNKDTTLKNLLDAQMYLSEAVHDLLVRKNKESAQGDLQKTLNYLLEAEKVAQPDIKLQLITFVDSIRGLAEKTTNLTIPGNNNETDKLLAIANNSLVQAKEKASPKTKIEIQSIIASISKVRMQIEHENLREDYERAMHALSKIIDNF